MIKENFQMLKLTQYVIFTCSFLQAIQTDNPFRWCISTLAIDITGVLPPPTQNETLRFQFQRYNVTLSESTPVSTIVKSLHPTGQKKVFIHFVI